MSISSLPAQASSGSQANNNRLSSVIARAPQLEVIAAKLFSGTVSSRIEEDAENPESKYLVVQVDTHDDLESIARSRRNWNKQTLDLLGDECDLVMLAVTVHD
jgi:hypothetical protein